MLDVALHQDKLANLSKQLTAHVEPFFPIPPVNTITKLRYMTISPITIVKRNIKYRTSKYSKNGICNEKNKSKIQNLKTNKVSITKTHRTANPGKLQHTILCHNYKAM